jgi:hypothetical protein
VGIDVRRSGCPAQDDSVLPLADAASGDARLPCRALRPRLVVCTADPGRADAIAANLVRVALVVNALALLTYLVRVARELRSATAAIVGIGVGIDALSTTARLALVALRGGAADAADDARYRAARRTADPVLSLRSARVTVVGGDIDTLTADAIDADARIGR